MILKDLTYVIPPFQRVKIVSRGYPDLSLTKIHLDGEWYKCSCMNLEVVDLYVDNFVLVIEVYENKMFNPFEKDIEES